SGAFPTTRLLQICKQCDRLNAGRLFMYSSEKTPHTLWFHSCAAGRTCNNALLHCRRPCSRIVQTACCASLRCVGFGTRLIDLDIERLLNAGHPHLRICFPSSFWIPLRTQSMLGNATGFCLTRLHFSLTFKNPLQKNRGTAFRSLLQD